MPTCLLALLQATIAVTEVPVLDLSRPDVRETIELHLPTDVRAIEDFWPNPVGGWVFHSPRLERASRDWSLGRATQVWAVHARTGREVEWNLPAISESEQRAWDARWAGGGTTPLFRLGMFSSLMVLPNDGGVLLQDTDNQRRVTHRLGLDGSVHVDDRFPLGPRCYPLSTDPDNREHTGAHTRGLVLGLGRREWTSLHSSTDLTVDPNWGPEVVRGGQLSSRIENDALFDGRSWTVHVETRIWSPMTVPGSPGPYTGPTHRALTRVSIRSGDILARSVIEQGSPFWSVLDALDPAMWSLGDEVVGLTACRDSVIALAHGTWTFAIARPEAAGSGAVPPGWEVRTVSIEGPPATSPPRLLGELQPGLVLYRTFHRDPHGDGGESRTVWLAVGG